MTIQELVMGVREEIVPVAVARIPCTAIIVFSAIILGRPLDGIIFALISFSDGRSCAMWLIIAPPVNDEGGGRKGPPHYRNT